LIDEASRQLLLAFARTMSEKPVLILLLHRPIPQNSSNPFDQEVRSFFELLVEMTPTQSLTVHAQQPTDIDKLITEQLGGDGPSRLLSELCWQMSSGNPLFIVELTRFLHDRGAIEFQEGTQKWFVAGELISRLRQNRCVQTDIDTGELTLVKDATLSESILDIPDRLYSLLQARVDNVPKQYQSTLQLASIIGRTFDLSLLVKAHFYTTDPHIIRQQAVQLEQLKVIETKDEEKNLYAFSSPAMQETIYNNLITEQRQQSHARVGAALEEIEPQAVEQLAYHYGLSHQREKKLYYLDLAAAKSQRESANLTALSFYNEALQEEERVEWLKGKIEVLDILGERSEQASTLAKLSHYTKQLPYHLPYLNGRRRRIRPHRASQKFDMFSTN